MTLQLAARLAALFGVGLLSMAAPARAATAITIGGPFSLTTADGASVTDRTYAGKWLLVYFGYTFCPSSCPTALLTMATALNQLGPDAAKLQPLFITVDPVRDTPAVLREYTAAFDPRIVGLTGTAQQIADVAREYGVYYSPSKTGPAPSDYLMDHSTYLYLIDPQGHFVRGFDSDVETKRLVDALRAVITETSYSVKRTRFAESNER